MNKNPIQTKKLKSIIPLRLSKFKLFFSILLILVGVGVLFSTFWINNAIQSEMHSAIADQITVPDEDDDDYEEWISNDNKNAVPHYSNFYMWNLTNKEEFLTGGKPVYGEVGPYVFREYTTKYNVHFSNNKEKVSYNQYYTYVFDPIKSELYKLDDKITNINPGYMGVLNYTKSEENLLNLITPTSLLAAKETFIESYNLMKDDILSDNNLSNLINQSVNNTELWQLLIKTGLLEDVMNYIKECVPSAEDCFQQEWSNGSQIICNPNLNLFPYTLQSICRGASIALFKAFRMFIENYTLTVHPTNINLYKDIHNMAVAAIRNAVIEGGADPDYEDNEDRIDDCANLLVIRVQELLNGDGYANKVFYCKWAGNIFPLINPGFMSGISLKILHPIGGEIIQNLPSSLIAEMIWEEANTLISNIDIDRIYFNNTPGRDYGNRNDLPLGSAGGYIDVEKTFGSDMIPSFDLNSYIFEALWDNNTPYSLVCGDLSYWYKAYDGDLEARKLIHDRFFFDTNRELQYNIPYDFYIDSILNWLHLGASTWIENIMFDYLEPYNNEYEPFIQNMVDDLINEAVGDIDIDRTYFNNETGRDYGAKNDLYSNLNASMSITQNLWNPRNQFSLVYDDISIWFDAIAGDLDSQNILRFQMHLNFSELNNLLFWLNNSQRDWINKLSIAEIEKMNSGLITTRTVEEWLFLAEDNLIKLVKPENAKVNLFDNCKSSDEANNVGVDYYTINTGKNDIKMVAQTLEFNSDSEISIWEHSIDISGTDGSQFAPYIEIDNNLEIFMPELMRPVSLSFSKLISKYDIELYRYRFSEDLFEVNSEYFMDIKGLANMYKKYGIPVYLSKPHLLDAQISVVNGLIGINPNPEYHDTYIDVEPITGMTMNARARLQINFKVNPTDQWYSNVQETYVPILWVEKEAEITEELAKEFKDALYENIKLQQILNTTLSCSGAITILIGGLLLYNQTIMRKLFKAQLIKFKYGL